MFVFKVLVMKYRGRHCAVWLCLLSHKKWETLGVFIYFPSHCGCCFVTK